MDQSEEEVEMIEDDEYTNAPLERLAYSVREAAKVLGISRQTLHRYERDGRIAFKKIDGHRLFVTREELLRFLAESPPLE
jgi:excisionase family DNA binding protein